MESVKQQTNKQISPWKTKLGIITLLFSLLTLWCGVEYIKVLLVPLTSLEIPLSLKGADNNEADFKIGVKGRYAVKLYDYRSYPNDHKKSEALLSQIDASWKITSQGKEVQCPWNGLFKSTSWSHADIGRVLCHFDGELGKYHIAFKFTKKPDIVLFNEPKLTLHVGLGGMDESDYIMKGVLLSSGLIVFGSIGLILLFFLYHPAIFRKWGVPLLVLLVVFLGILIDINLFYR